MPHVSTETKHAILLEYAPHAPSRTFAALAARHSVKGGWRVLQRWHQQWDGTARSLQRKAGSGKQRLLSRAQISRHVRAPILAANRSHRAISYTQLLPAVQAKKKLESSCPCARYAATARRSTEPSTSTPRSVQQLRVSALQQAIGCMQVHLWSAAADCASVVAVAPVECLLRCAMT
jgi:hypothetical protein